MRVSSATLGHSTMQSKTLPRPLYLPAWRGRVTPEIVLLAVGSAAGLAGVDVYYVATRVIAKIYLL